MNKTTAVIKVLMSGGKLGLREIAEKVTGISGKETKVHQISGLMTRLSDAEKCDLGHFIRKNKVRGVFAYEMVPEALALSLEQALGLYRKTGKGKYTLGQAAEDHPALRRFAEPGDRVVLLKKRSGRKKPAPPEPVRAVENPVSDAEAVFGLIRKSPDGADAATLAKKTELDDDTVCRILLKLGAEDKVFRAGMGIYKAV